MGSIGFTEMLFIALLALLIFGPRKLPQLARTIGRPRPEFRRASGDLRHQLEDEVRTLEQQAQSALDGAEPHPTAALPAPYQQGGTEPAPSASESAAPEMPKTDAEPNTPA